MEVCYVTRYSKCPECGGHGVVTHPAWQNFWREWTHETWREHVRSQDLPEAWLLQEYFGGDPPPEEIECPECNGEGVICRLVPLEEVLRELLGNRV